MTQVNAKSTQRTGAGKSLSLRKRGLYGMLVSLAFIGMLEGTLTLLGIVPVAQLRDPYVGFSGQANLFELDSQAEDEAILVTSAPKQIWFNEQSFRLRKSPGTRRIFCVGGSTTYGRPYSDPTSFCGWLRELLPLVDESREWEVINAGGVSYASYRVAAVMEELVRYEPDLFVIYTAHNEFLERRTYSSMFEQSSAWIDLQALFSKTRLYALMDRIVVSFNGSSSRQVSEGGASSEVMPSEAMESTRAVDYGHSTSPKYSSLPESRLSSTVENVLPGEVDERLNHTIGPTDYHRDSQWREGVLRHYEFNLRRMVRLARSVGAEVILVTPASNEMACSPFKSEFSDGVTESQQQRFTQLMGIALGLANAGEFDDCLVKLGEARQIESRYADLSYLQGRALLAMERYAEAAEAFQQAIDEDICPLRAIPEIDEIIRRVADDCDVPCVDFNRLLHDQCEEQFGHRCLGEPYFLDHVHPTIDVHRQLALWIMACMQQEQLLENRNAELPSDDGEGEAGQGGLLQSLLNSERYQQVIDRVYGGIDHQVQGIALRNLAKVLHWSGKYEEAIPRAIDALQRLPDDAESRFVLADCFTNTGRLEKALGQYQLLMQSDQGFPRAYLPYAELLMTAGDLVRAKEILLLAIVFRPENAYAYELLGQVHLALGEEAEAVQALQAVERLSGNSQGVLELLPVSPVDSRD